MVNAILISKSGVLSSIHVNNLTELYKKCKFRSPDGFSQRAEWSLTMNGKQYTIRLYAKLEGKSINKYMFPPPVDMQTFYGDCILVNIVDDEIEDLSISEWTYHEQNFNVEEEIIEEDVTDNELEEEPYDYKIDHK